MFCHDFLHSSQDNLKFFTIWIDFRIKKVYLKVLLKITILLRTFTLCIPPICIVISLPFSFFSLPLFSFFPSLSFSFLHSVAFARIYPGVMSWSYFTNFHRVKKTGNWTDLRIVWHVPRARDNFRNGRRISFSIEFVRGKTLFRYVPYVCPRNKLKRPD